ncbi:MAG: hypothetical protein LBL30_03485 [Holosporales bacterium]|jgi:hypothetical protein|nr:hypothetical protein [Holosporales bacterium]
MMNLANLIPTPDLEEYSIYTEESAIDVVQELESYLRENSRVRFCIDPSWMS